jgi:myosin heavy subunit
VDDAADFRGVNSALADLGIPEEDLQQLWGLLAGLLWLGNLTIIDHDHADGSSVKQVCWFGGGGVRP